MYEILKPIEKKFKPGVSTPLKQAYKFDILKKKNTQEQKTQNSRKKLNNSIEKLKDSTKLE